MADELGETIYPRHCRVSVSQDKTQLALTFQSQDRTPLTIILPLLGAAGLQRKVAHCLYLLGVRPIEAQGRPEASPAPH